MNTQILDSIPMWAVYPLSVLTLLAFLEAGYWLGKFLKRKSAAKNDAGVGVISGATLALLAFLLAFTVSFAVGVFGERRVAVLEEANAIGTTYLRAGFLEEPYSTQSRDLLREYVDMRLAAIGPADIEMAITRSEEIHKELWNIAEPLVIENPNPINALYIDSLNKVIDMHTERLVISMQVRVPPFLVLGMYIVGFFTMLLIGIHGGYIGNRNFIAQLVLVLILAMVFYLIIDLDRAQQGLLRVPQGALIGLRQSLSP